MSSFNKENYLDNQNKVKKEIKEIVENILKSFKESPENVIEYLKFSSKFYRYSDRNNRLIMAQNKYASFVGSFSYFQKLDYRVKKGEKSIKMFAYLSKSIKIEKQVIDNLYKRKMIYQDEKGNISFVGYKKDNKAEFVFKRGTNTNKIFKKVVSGISFETAFFVDNNSDSIFITEAIIDNMSIMSMLLHNNIDFTKYNYLSLCGTCTKSINTYIKDNEKMSTIYIYLC